MIATQLTNYISNTLTPQIKGKSGAGFPFAPGQHHVPGKVVYFFEI